MEKKTNYSRILRFGHVLIFLFLISLFVYIFAVYLYPFFIGVIISFILLPFVNFIEKVLGWKRVISVFFVIISFVLFFSALITIFIAEIIVGLSYLTKEVPYYIKDGFNYINKLFEQLLTFTTRLSEDQQLPISKPLEGLIQEVGSQLSNLTQVILNGLTDMLLALPGAATIIFFSLLGAFFITKDWPIIIQWIESKTPKKAQEVSNKIAFYFKKAIFRYILAQLILVSITGVIVLIGLLIIGVDYAVTAALLIAFVDLLPYLGTGLIFIPWILYMFLNGNWYVTIGLAILYVVVIVQRQLTEPKIVAKQIGIPPLALLVTLFVCFQVIGLLGLLIGPAILMVIQAVIRAGVLEEAFAYIKG